MGKVDMPAVSLPHPVLDGSDWADAYRGTMTHDFATAREAADAFFRALPRWMIPALVLRQIAVTPFGLKGVAAAESGAGDRVGIFPVVSDEPDRIVLGFDDRHLDFRILAELAGGTGRQVLTVTTAIRRHNALGRAYLAAVTPFHRALLRTAMARLSR